MTPCWLAPDVLYLFRFLIKSQPVRNGLRVLSAIMSGVHTPFVPPSEDALRDIALANETTDSEEEGSPDLTNE